MIGRESVNGFVELLEDFVDAKGIVGAAELTVLLNTCAIRWSAALFEEEEVYAVTRGWTNPHPVFFRCLKEGLGLTDEEALRLTWAFFMDRGYPEGLALPHALPGP